MHMCAKAESLVLFRGEVFECDWDKEIDNELCQKTTKEKKIEFPFLGKHQTVRECVYFNNNKNMVKQKKPGILA